MKQNRKKTECVFLITHVGCRVDAINNIYASSKNC